MHKWYGRIKHYNYTLPIDAITLFRIILLQWCAAIFLCFLFLQFYLRTFSDTCATFSHIIPQIVPHIYSTYYYTDSSTCYSTYYSTDCFTYYSTDCSTYYSTYIFHILYSHIGSQFFVKTTDQQKDESGLTVFGTGEFYFIEQLHCSSLLFACFPSLNHFLRCSPQFNMFLT